MDNPETTNPQVAYSANEISEFQSKFRFSMNDIFLEIDKRLQGRLLTLVDASFTDPIQRKAFKDMVANNISQTISKFQDLAWNQDRGVVSDSQ